MGGGGREKTTYATGEGRILYAAALVGEVVECDEGEDLADGLEGDDEEPSAVLWTWRGECSIEEDILVVFAVKSCELQLVE